MKCLILLLILCGIHPAAAQIQTQYFTGTVSYPQGLRGGAPPLLSLPTGSILSGSYEVNTAGLSLLTSYSSGKDYIGAGTGFGSIFIGDGTNTLNINGLSAARLSSSEEYVGWAENDASESASATLHIFCAVPSGGEVSAFTNYNLDAFPLYIPTPTQPGTYCSAVIDVNDDGYGIELTIGLIQYSDPAPTDPPIVAPNPVIPPPTPIRPPAPPVQPSPPPPPPLNLRILMDVKPITGVMTVAIGQRINLSAEYILPTGAQASNSWGNIPGSAIAGYERTPLEGKVTYLDDNSLTKKDLQFYWIDPDLTSDAGRTVTFTVSSNGGIPVSASATFKVVGPIATINRSIGEVVVENHPDYNERVGGDAVLALKTLRLPGVIFTLQEQRRSPVTGKYVWTQLVHDVENYFKEAGEQDIKQDWGCYIDLDPKNQTVVDYPKTPGLSANTRTDTPEQKLDVKFFAVSRNFKATMYLQWQPSAENSIPVPLGSVNWGYSGTAGRVTNDYPRSIIRKYEWLLQPGSDRSLSLFEPSNTSFAQWTSQSGWDPSADHSDSVGCQGRNPHQNF